MSTLARRHATQRLSALNSSLSSLVSRLSSRSGFTLIELIVVVLVMLILLTLTIAVVGNMMDSGRVRGASSTIQNYLAGARDRAIYSASRNEGSGVPPLVGVRFLSDPSLVDSATGRYRGFSSMVFVQQVAPMPTSLSVYKEVIGGTTYYRASQFRVGDPNRDGNFTPVDRDNGGSLDVVDRLNIHGIQSLIGRGLVASRYEIDSFSGNRELFYYLKVYFDDVSLGETFYVRFQAVQNSGNPNIVNGRLVEGTISKLPDTPQSPNIAACHFHLLPAPMPNEEPRLLPENVVINMKSSLVGSAPQYDPAGTPPFRPVPAARTLQSYCRADGSFDIMFNAQGVVAGDLAGYGIVHLVVSDLEDLARGFSLIQYKNVDADPADEAVPGFAFVDSDNDGTFDDSDNDLAPDERLYEAQIVSIRTQTGSVYSSNIHTPTVTTAGPNFGRYKDPYGLAETGGEAR